ncbi:unnamed protein product [Mucor hiemalis]
MMQHGRDSSLSSISGSFNDSYSIASLGSPILSPHVSPGGSPRDSLNTQFTNSMSLLPPSSNSKNNTSSSSNNNNSSSSNNTFVHKLYNMVVDLQYQHLIAWSYTGSSFIVCNIMEFSRDVLPKHFKHNNFSSFVRQLNMYGFHKVNKSPRGHRTLAENQIWEFSHQKFIKDRPDYLDEIKRKSLETETTRRDQGDINSHMTMMQVSQSEMVQQLARLQSNFNTVVKELAETRNKQHKQQQMLESMMKFLTSKQAQHLNNNTETYVPESRPPSIFITSHDNIPPPPPPSNQNYFIQSTRQQFNPRPSLTVQTQNLPFTNNLSPGLNPMVDGGVNSPSLSAYHTALNTPVSPSPSQFISDDDIPSLYSPHSPMTPNTFSLHEQQHQQQQQFYQQAHQNDTLMMDHNFNPAALVSTQQRI